VPPAAQRKAVRRAFDGRIKVNRTISGATAGQLTTRITRFADTCRSTIPGVYSRLPLVKDGGESSGLKHIAAVRSARPCACALRDAVAKHMSRSDARWLPTSLPSAF